jgi:hypothetical protein
LARQYTDAGVIEKAAGLWGKAGQRSLERSALVEAVVQFTQGFDLITTLPATPALRREQIKLQVGLVNALMHVKGYAAAETKSAIERARMLMQRAEALGELPEDPLILSSILYALWTANTMAFNGDISRDLAAQCLALAEKQGATGPLMIGHRVYGYVFVVYGQHCRKPCALPHFLNNRETPLQSAGGGLVRISEIRSMYRAEDRSPGLISRQRWKCRSASAHSRAR